MDQTLTCKLWILLKWNYTLDVGKSSEYPLEYDLNYKYLLFYTFLFSDFTSYEADFYELIHVHTFVFIRNLVAKGPGLK